MNRRSDLSRSQKLLAIVGTLILMAVLYNYKFSASANLHESASAEKLVQRLPNGDADSPIDTIRRLKENARQAADIAAGAKTELADHKQATESRLNQMTQLLKTQTKATESKLGSELSSLASQLNNFMTLVEGRTASPAVVEIPERTPPHNDWVEVAPVNTYTTSSSNQWKPLLPSRSSNEADAYQTNNGLFLNTSLAGLTNLDPGDEQSPQTIFPVVTIAENSPLLHATTLSTLIGRVPKGGQVFEPYTFYILTGTDNWTSQAHPIPFIEKAIWRGVATGDKDLECVRGKLVSVTFVFTDGTIQTTTGSVDEPLAEIVTPTGSNCVPGQFVSNTAKYIAMLGAAGGIAGLGSAIANNETISSFTPNGNLITSIDGSTGNYIAGKTIAAGADKTAQIIESEYRNSFASVVLPSGLSVNLMALTQIDIDYNTQGRKVSYVDPTDYQ